jgi:predicted DCC family thiol-disulfide oxidoreductase YuxK
MGSPEAAKTQPSWFTRLADHLRDTYLTADLCWLGVLRILLGTLLSVDLIRRWTDARTFYTNDGILPNHFSMFRPMGRNVFSIYHAFSTLGEISVAFAFSLVFFVLFTVGWRTKLFHILSFVCITSLNARNIFVENGGTVVVNILAFWTLFMPLGKRLSVDSVLSSMRKHPEQSAEDLRQPLPRDNAPVVTLAVLALLLQWASIYFFNAAHKTGRGWHDGTAIWWFWQQDRIVTWFGIWAREHVPIGMIRYLTWSVLGMEGTLPVLLLFPVWRVWLRRIGLLLAIGLHGGIALSSRLGPFSYVMTIAFVGLLSAPDWQLLARWFGRSERAKTVIYDSGCGVCFEVARLLRRFDPFERLSFVGSHETERLPSGVDAAMLERTVVVVDAKGRIHLEERAVFEALRALPGGSLLAFWMRVPGLSNFARFLYRAFARNRMRISTWLGLSACGVPASAPEARPASAADAQTTTLRKELDGLGALVRECAVAGMIVVLGSQSAVENVFLRRFVHVRQPEWMATVVAYPRLFQGWGMFAPEPPYDDGRFIVDGRTADGRKLDPLTGAEPDFDPYAPHGWGHDQLWCDFHNRIRFPGHSGNRQHLRDYLLNLHVLRGLPEDRLVAFDVWWIQDRSPPPGQQHGEPLPPQKLLSYGVVRDSGASQWLAQGARR